MNKLDIWLERKGYLVNTRILFLWWLLFGSLLNLLLVLIGVMAIFIGSRLVVLAAIGIFHQLVIGVAYGVYFWPNKGDKE